MPLPRFHQHKGRRGATGELHGHARPLRDRAIVHTLLGNGPRREEQVNLDLDQVTPEALRAAKKAKISGVRGKGGTSRTVFLGADGRTALADYLETRTPSRRRRDVDRAVAVRGLDRLPAAPTVGSRRARST